MEEDLSKAERQESIKKNYWSLKVLKEEKSWEECTNWNLECQTKDFKN